MWEPELMDDFKKTVVFCFLFVFVFVFLKTQLGKGTNKLTNWECMQKSSLRSKQTKIYHGGGKVAMKFLSTHS